MIETEVFPYEPSRLLGERLLVLAPHPDDEVIGCGGLIAIHAEEKRDVRIGIVTDGTEATSATPDRAAYRDRREAEAITALGRIGVSPEQITFLRFPDRRVAESQVEIGARLRELLRSDRPDLIALPSPAEVHPDHVALARTFCELIARDPDLAAELGFARIAFYEVSHPIRPNTIVDISGVAERKYAAIADHVSQLEVRDYISYARGLNAYRAMTLPKEVRAAEAYLVMPIATLRTTPFTEIVPGIMPRTLTVSEPVPISVIVRTKDRPALLREAVQSIRATGYPAETVIVNDGGSPLPDFPAVKVIRHETSQGRSEAMNRGVREATGVYIAFLDDDDLFHPEHLATLAQATNHQQYAAWYTDAISTFGAIGPTGTFDSERRMRIFARDFDRDALLIDNYIPLTTLLVRKNDYLEAGGFDTAFDLFEDWDFLIRLSARGMFLRIARVTCEIRHIEGGGSITLASPEGSNAFREARLRVWKKHSIGADAFARYVERQKRESVNLNNELTEERGRRHHAETDIIRLEREKNELLEQVKTAVMRFGEASARHAELEVTLHRILEQFRVQAEERGAALDALAREKENLRRDLSEHASLVRHLYSETDRLQGLLDLIYRSRTWRLHTMMEKVRGR